MGVFITGLGQPTQPPLQPSSQLWGGATLSPSHPHSSEQETQRSKVCVGVGRQGQARVSGAGCAAAGPDEPPALLRGLGSVQGGLPRT